MDQPMIPLNPIQQPPLNPPQQPPLNPPQQPPLNPLQQPPLNPPPLNPPQQPPLNPLQQPPPNPPQQTPLDRLKQTPRDNMILAIGLSLNFGEWIAMIYLVKRIEDNDKSEYNAIAWGAVFTSATIFLFLILCIYFAFTVNINQNWGLLTRIANYFVLVLCFVLVLAYFYASAIPTYRSTIWKTDIDFYEEIRSPAVIVCGDYNDAASAKLQDGWSACQFPRFSDDGSTNCLGDIQQQLQILTTERFGSLKCYVFEISTDTMFNTTSKELLIKSLFQWNSTAIHTKYTTNAPQNPQLYWTPYDSRLSLDNLSQVIDCGLLRLTEIPAFGSNTVNVEAIRIRDTKGATIPNLPSLQCQTSAIVKLYGESEPYTTYNFHLSSSGSSYGSACNVDPVNNGTGDAELSRRDAGVSICINQLVLHFGSFQIQTRTSLPGIEPMDILGFISSIVGWITFFALFISLLDT